MVDIGGGMRTAQLNVKVDSKGAKRGADQVNRSIGGMGIAAERTSGSMKLLTKAMIGFGAAIGGYALIRYADQWTSATNSLKLFIDEEKELIKTQNQLFKIAQKTRSPFNQIVELFFRASQARVELQATNQEIVAFTELIGKAIQISGSSQAAAEGALLQLGQALQSGRVYAEEWNSIVEGAFRVAKAAATEIPEAQGNVGKLKKVIQEGNVSSKKLFAAIMRDSENINREFDKMAPTIGGAFTTLNNASQKFVGNISDATGASKIFAKMLIKLAKTFTTYAKVAAIAAAATLAWRLTAGDVGAIWQGVLSILKQVVRVMKAVIAAMAANPFGVVLVAITALVGVVLAFGDQIKPIRGDLANLHDYAVVAWKAILKFGSGIAGMFGSITSKVDEMFNLLGGGGGDEGIMSTILQGWLDSWKFVVNHIISLILGIGSVWKVALTPFSSKETFKEAFTKHFGIDHVGNIITGLKDIGKAWREAAEERAKAREQLKKGGEGTPNHPADLYGPPVYVRPKATKADIEAGKKLTQEFDMATRVNASIREANDLRERGAITYEVYVAAVQKAYEAEELILNNMDSWKAKVIQLSDSWKNELTNSLVNFALKGKFHWSNFRDEVIQSLTQMAIKAAIVTPIFKALEAALNSVTGYFGLGGSSTDPGTERPTNETRNPVGRASGGAVMRRKTYIVGEKGPELFSPSNSGYIVPNNRLGSSRGGDVKINVYNNAPGVDAKATARPDNNGGFDIEIMVNRISERLGNDIMRGSGLAPVLENRYALNSARGMRL